MQFHGTLQENIHSEKVIDQGLISFLSEYVSTERLAKMKTVLANRTRYLTLVLEDIYQPHNASAVLRSCDCFGVQDVHIIENRNKYQVNPDVELGSEKWLSLIRYKEKSGNTSECLSGLKSKGYLIGVTSPARGIQLSDIKLNQPLAIVFGTELEGVSEEALSFADMLINIPMVGFTQSFNISVSAALVMYELTTQLRNSSLPWQLSGEEQNLVMLDWLRRTVKKSHLLEEVYAGRKAKRL